MNHSLNGSEWLDRFLAASVELTSPATLVESEAFRTPFTITFALASLYEAFTPTEARRLIERLEPVYTPKHGSSLDIAEIELNVLARQCLDRRIADKLALVREIGAWESERNAIRKPVNWRFTTDDARIKLKRLYPQFEA